MSKTCELSLLSKGAKQKLKKWHDEHIEIERDDWDTFFLNRAINVSTRSLDSQTKVGAVLVKNNTELSSGYNGPIRNAKDYFIPNVRPDKYQFFIHAEVNAVLNAARLGHSTLGSTCYCTHQPCQQCLQFLWQAGISRIIYCKNYAKFNSLEGDIDEFYEIFQFLTGGQLKIEEHETPKNL